MKFHPDNVRKILAGEKTETRRPVNYENPNSPWHSSGCRYRPGKSVAVQETRGHLASKALGRISIVTCHQERLGDLNRSGARREGFDSLDAFFAHWAELHGDVDREQKVWVLRFVLVEVVQEAEAA